jgi:ADP-heptose:LPS heptosyltransferase/GT2 family glycosyltransferase
MEDMMLQKGGGGFRLPKGKLWVNSSKSSEIFYNRNHEPIVIRPGEKMFDQFLSDADIKTYFVSPELWNAHRLTEELFREKDKISILIDASKIDKLGDSVMITVIPKAYKIVYEGRVKIYVAANEKFKSVWENNPYIEPGGVLYEVPTDVKIMFDSVLDVNGLELKWREKAADRRYGYRNRNEVILENLGLFLFDRNPVWAVTEDEKAWAKTICNKLPRPLIGFQTESSCKTRTVPQTQELIDKIKNKYSVIQLDEKISVINFLDKFCTNKDWAYKFTVREMAAIINECDVIVAPDSAAFHIAGALKKRTVALFGHTDGKMYCEDYEKADFIQGSCPLGIGPCWWTLDCIDGSSYQEKADKEYTRCLKDIKADDVIALIEKHLTKPKKVLVCMLTYNLLEMTKKALTSIRAWNDYDVFVVDNASTDGTPEWLKAQGIDYESKRTGVAAAQNIGLKKFLAGDYDHFLLVNNDITLRFDCIDKLVDFLENNNDVYGVFATTAQCAPWFIDSQTPQKSMEIVTDIPPGAYSATLFSRECVEVVGMFDERFKPRYIEDNDYTLRIRLAGKKFCRTGAALFYHVLGGVIKTNEEEIKSRDIHWVTNIRLYQEKWGIHPHESQALGKIKKNIIDTGASLYRMSEFIISKGTFHLAIRRWMGGLGDHIFMSVIAEVVKKKFPTCEITYVVPKAFKEAYAFNKFIDTVQTDDWENLQADMKIDCTDIDYKFELIEMQKYGRIVTPRDQIYLNYISIFGDETHPTIKVDEAATDWANKEWGVEDGIRKIAIAKETTNLLKTWPGMTALINKLKELPGVCLKILDEKSGLTYKYSFTEALKLMSVADVVISLDSAFSNAGGALGVPTIAIFGYRGGSVFQKMFPSMEIVQIPCPIDGKTLGCDYSVKCIDGADHRSKENRKIPPCLSGIPVEVVLAKAKELLCEKS